MKPMKTTTPYRSSRGMTWKYKGKKVKRYRYRILNYPERKNAAATLLVYKGEILGGDITLGGDTSQVRGLAFPEEQQPGN